MLHLKLSKHIFLGQKFEKKNVIHMDLWKYGKILTIQKSLMLND